MGNEWNMNKPQTNTNTYFRIFIILGPVKISSSASSFSLIPSRTTKNLDFLFFALTTATLGGNFGLFLGASVLTILQLLEYIFDEVTATCTCKSPPTNRVGSSRAKPAVKDDVTKTTDDDISIIEMKKDSWNENYTER